MTNDQKFYLYAYAPVVLIGLIAGFFGSRYLCHKNKRRAATVFITFPGLAFIFYFTVLFTSGIIGEAAKFILVYTFMFAPPFWLGGMLALPFIKQK